MLATASLGASLTAAAGDGAPAQYSADWWGDVLVGRPLQVALIVVLTIVARWIVFRVIDTFVEGLAYRRPSKRGRPARLGGQDDDADAEEPAASRPGGAEPARGGPARRGRWRRLLPRRLRGVGQAAEPGPTPAEQIARLTYEPAEAAYRERKVQRAATVGQLLRSVATFLIVGVAVVMVLDVLGLPVAPLLASAGFLGAALGFGAQNLVRDFVSGVFMLIEDQYGVGDFIDMGQATGIVESVSLRVTGLRDDNGTMWWVRNGEVLRVGNKSQGWARAVIDVTVGTGDDLARVRDVLQRTADDLAADPDWAERVLEPPEVAGVEQLTRDTAVVRVSVTTPPGDQFAVQRELRERLYRVLLVKAPDE